MLFNSFEFLIFLAVVLAVYYLLLPRRLERARRAFLLLASYVFYASWNPPFALLLLASTLLDFGVGRRLAREEALRRRRGLLALSVAGNLGILGYFKYGNFLEEVFYDLFGGLVARPEGPGLDIVLPIGISFYTFQSLSYSIDVYRRALPATRSLLDFALYVSFFPQLVAGPIVRAATFLPQLERRHHPSASEVELALARIAGGLVKKVALADSLGRYVDVVFANPAGFGGANLLLALYAFAFQVYFDFSGYSDMAIGLARLFGFHIPENFNRPYLAANPAEFWQRWHISLSTWLRDYLFVPLRAGGDSAARTAFALVTTLLLGGLWHGAAWTFVLWGAYHAALLGGYFLLFARRPHRPRTPLALRQIALFHGVCLSFALFRAADLGDAADFLRGLASIGTFQPSREAWLAIGGVSLAAALHRFSGAGSLPRRFAGLRPAVQGAAYAFAAGLVFLLSPAGQRFIYFQF